MEITNSMIYDFVSLQNFAMNCIISSRVTNEVEISTLFEVLTSIYSCWLKDDALVAGFMPFVVFTVAVR